MYSTRQKMICRFGTKILDKFNGVDNKPSFVAMDGGIFYFKGTDEDKDNLIEMWCNLQAVQDYDFGLVPCPADNTIFFADIDHMAANWNVKKLGKAIANAITTILKRTEGERIRYKELVWFKSVTDERYHVYHSVRLDKAYRVAVWRNVNKHIGSDVIDENVRAIRTELFEKWNKVEKGWNTSEAGSRRYVPIGIAADYPIRKLYEVSWITPFGFEINKDSIFDYAEDESSDDDDDVATAEIKEEDEEDEQDSGHHSVIDMLYRRANNNIPSPNIPFQAANNNNNKHQKNKPRIAINVGAECNQSRNNNIPSPNIPFQSANNNNNKHQKNKPRITINVGAEGNQSRNNNNTEAEAENENKSQEGSRATSMSVSPNQPAVNANIPKKLVNKIQVTYPHIAHILLQHNICAIQNFKHTIVFALDPRDEQTRNCPIKNGIHQSNQTYLAYHVQTKRLARRCYKAECNRRCPMGVAIYEPPSDEIEAGETIMDRAVAQLFVKLMPHVMYQQSGRQKSGVWYAYRADPGYWMIQSETAMCSIIGGEFFEVLIDYAAKSNGAEREKLTKVMKRLGSLNNVKSSLGYIKSLCLETKIDWNAKQEYTVFINGVLQCDKRDKDGNFIFGATFPEEHINDDCVMYGSLRYPLYGADLEAMEARAQQLMEDWFIKVQPDADDRRTLLQWVSLIFNNNNYKTMIINCGASGNNSKSSLFEFCLYSCDSYGLLGDKKLVTKGGGKADKVSQAEMSYKRLVLFEEPSADHALNIEYIKDIVGGSRTTVGRKNFSNDNVVHLHCKVALNANVLSSVHLQQAMVSRCLLFSWNSQFTTNKALVNPSKHIYLADPKYKTREYWSEQFPVLMHILLIHYKQFKDNNDVLFISEAAQKRTLRELQAADPFITWLDKSYVLLVDTKKNREFFVTRKELSDQLALETPQDLRKIAGRNQTAASFLKNTLKAHCVAKYLYKAKYTNYRITLEQRKKPEAKNQTGADKQYVGPCLIRTMSKTTYAAASVKYQTMQWTDLYDECNVASKEDDEAGDNKDDESNADDNDEAGDDVTDNEMIAIVDRIENDMKSSRDRPRIQRSILQYMFNNNMQSIADMNQSTDVTSDNTANANANDQDDDGDIELLSNSAGFMLDKGGYMVEAGRSMSVNNKNDGLNDGLHDGINDGINDGENENAEGIQSDTEDADYLKEIAEKKKAMKRKKRSFDEALADDEISASDAPRDNTQALVLDGIIAPTPKQTPPTPSAELANQIKKKFTIPLKRSGGQLSLNRNKKRKLNDDNE